MGDALDEWRPFEAFPQAFVVGDLRPEVREDEFGYFGHRLLGGACVELGRRRGSKSGESTSREITGVAALGQTYS